MWSFSACLQPGEPPGHIAILGAGPTGLCAAVRLAELGEHDSQTGRHNPSGCIADGDSHKILQL